MAGVGSPVASLPVCSWPNSTLAGFFTQISTLADVQENVMEYLHVLSRPKVIDQEHDVVWTEAYIDSTVSHRPQGAWGVIPVFISEETAIGSLILYNGVQCNFPSLYSLQTKLVKM